jgi:hypothetical protein
LLAAELARYKVEARSGAALSHRVDGQPHESFSSTTMMAL